MIMKYKSKLSEKIFKIEYENTTQKRDLFCKRLKIVSMEISFEDRAILTYSEV